MKSLNIILSCFIVLFSLTACGNKGELKLAPQVLPPAVPKFGVQQTGFEIRLEWTLPVHLSDGKTPLFLDSVKRFIIHATDNPQDREKFSRKPGTHSKISMKEVTVSGERNFSWAIPCKERDLKNKTYLFSVSYEYGRNRSLPGPIQTLKTMIPVETVRDLKVRQEKKAVILTWEHPLKDRLKEDRSGQTGFYVYRRIQVADTLSSPVRLSNQPETRAYFEDVDTGNEGEYQYVVTVAMAPKVESAPSAPALIRIEDRFPPDTPLGLVAFTASDHILLIWKQVPDTDLANYRIFRKSKEDEEFKLLEDKVEGIQYKDFQVKAGLMYFYAVSAVDRKGNESKPTPALMHEFE